MVLSLNHLLGRFGFLKSAVTGRTMALVEATELQFDLRLFEALSPTALSVVPRVMEHIWNGILETPPVREAWEELERLDQAKEERTEAERERFRALCGEINAALRRALGGRIKYISYSGAAMPPRIMRFFELAQIPLIGSYGSTECGGVTLCGIGENRPGSLGKPFGNVEIRIAEDSEILVRRPDGIAGYFKDAPGTAEVFEPDGWYRTGDLGVLDPDGSLA